MNATHAISLIYDKLMAWGRALVLMLPNLIIAILVVIGFSLLARFIGQGVRKVFFKVLHKKEAIAVLISKTTSLAVVLVGLLTALSILDLDKTVTSLLAGVGVMGLALGFAFQDIASNFMSGILISVQHPCEVGDLIKTGNFVGKVEKIALRSTTIRTFQGPTVIIPNKDILQGPLTNFTISGQRRVEIRVGVSYSEALEKVKDVAIAAVSSMTCRNAEREVEVHFEEFDDSSINFVLWLWVDYTEERDYVAARSEAIMRLKVAFNAAGICIPFPVRTLEFDDRAAAALRKVVLPATIEDAGDPRSKWKGSGNRAAQGADVGAGVEDGGGNEGEGGGNTPKG
jgi:small conductance mechanosensitive channel